MTFFKRAEKGATLSWWWLGIFGLTHGLNEWMGVAALFFGVTAVYRAIWFFVTALSFVFLMEFARRGTLVVFKKRLPPACYILLAALAGCGAFGGWQATQLILRFFFSFFAYGWSAVVLWFYQRNGADNAMPRFSRLCLKGVSLAMFLGALSTIGLAEPPASLLETNLLNIGGLPFPCFPVAHIIRGFFAMAAAVSLALYAVQQGLVVFVKDDATTKKRFIIFSLGSVLFMLFLFYLGWEAVDRYGRREETEEKNARSFKAEVFAQFVHLTVDRISTLRVLSGEPEVVRLFKEPDAVALASGNNYLDWFCRAAHVDACYAVNNDGVIVASDSGPHPSLIGRNESKKDYYRRASSGAGGIFFVRRPEEERGIYAAYPVFGSDGKESRRILGVAVARLDSRELDEHLRTYPFVFLVSPDGLIFASSRQEWVSRHLRDVLTAFPQAAAGLASADVDGLSGWRVVLADTRTSALPVRLILTMIFLSFFLLVAIISLFVFGIFLDSLHIAASEALHKALVEGTADAIQLFDNKGRCLSVNENGLKLFRARKTDVVGSFLENLWPKEYREKIQEAIGGVLGGVQEVLEVRKVFPDGSAAIHAVTLTPIFEFDGRVKYFVGVCRDVTEDHRARERLMQSCKMETVYALATGVCHEFNNVLEIILANAEFAALSADAELMKSTLKVVVESAKRGGWIVKTMVDLSGRDAEKREWVDIEDLLRQDLLLLRKVLEVEGIVIETAFKKAPRVFAHPAQLSQVFVNIMMNARDAMAGIREKKLTVSLDAAVDGASVTVCFQDTGWGIKEEIRPKIFGPFVTTKGILGGGGDTQPGTGLGLFTAYRIVKQHNGTITVDSEAGKGAKFCVTLPINNSQ